jgi:hypothetical protein
MPASMKKIVGDVIEQLKKRPSPEKRGQSFWDFMKEQLYSESTWDQDDLKVIEESIESHLNKLENKELRKLWESTDLAMDKIDEGKKVDEPEMKADLTNEMLGQVMDRMDDNYSGKSVYTPAENIYAEEGESGKKSLDEDGFIDDEKEPDDLDEDVDFKDDDLFNDTGIDDDDDSRF